jgi:hypothetical protein
LIFDRQCEWRLGGVTCSFAWRLTNGLRPGALRRALSFSMIGAKHSRGDRPRPNHIATHRQLHIEFQCSFRHPGSLLAAELSGLGRRKSKHSRSGRT